jgi:UDP-N-acetylmuramoyl-L-alanyl-D-glutamate--2,6-diaminopimelate ligase
MLAAGCEYALLEATSHGLAQHRVSACEFDVGVVTNITHDHLDFHRTVEEYRAAKARLFWHLGDSVRKPGADKVAVLNADDASYPILREIPADRRLVYSLSPGADLWPNEVHVSAEGLHFTAVTPIGRIAIESPLIGPYNVSNILAAVGAAVSQGIGEAAIREGVATMLGIPGRMERIDEGQAFTAVVDFAHTPNALRRALETLRPLTVGRLIVVFGCAGLRDPFKRPLMGQAAGELADLTVITAEDPRTEDLAAITDQVAGGCERAGRREGESYWRIGDRGEAIRFALGMAGPGDTVVVAGKGHEQSMCFGTVEMPWDDRVEVRKALKAMRWG